MKDESQIIASNPEMNDCSKQLTKIFLTVRAVGFRRECSRQIMAEAGGSIQSPKCCDSFARLLGSLQNFDSIKMK